MATGRLTRKPLSVRMLRICSAPASRRKPASASAPAFKRTSISAESFSSRLVKRLPHGKLSVTWLANPRNSSGKAWALAITNSRFGSLAREVACKFSRQASRPITNRVGCCSAMQRAKRPSPVPRSSRRCLKPARRACKVVSTGKRKQAAASGAVEVIGSRFSTGEGKRKTGPLGLADNALQLGSDLAGWSG